MKGYYLHPYGVVFHPVLDKLNGFQTVVYNWKADVFHRVDSVGYELLQLIEKKPGITLKELMEGRGRQEIKNFIEQMVNENIIIEK